MRDGKGLGQHGFLSENILARYTQHKMAVTFSAISKTVGNSVLISSQNKLY